MITALDRWLGLHTSASDLTVGQMAARAFVVFVAGLVIVRIADRRFLGRSAGFDVLLGVVLGSVLSRGVNGQAAFVPTLAASLLLVLLHRVVSTLACHFDWFSKLLKGNPKPLIRDGQLDRDELRRCSLSDDDLDENLRLHGNVSRIREVAEARLERNGEVSVVKREAGK